MDLNRGEAVKGTLRERWLAVAFAAIWALSLLAVWVAFSLTVPSVPANPAAVGATTEIRGPAWNLTYESTTRNATAFGHLREASVALAFELEYVGYGWPYEDVFVSSINSTRNDGARSLWWQFCVNGTYAELGAMRQVLRNGDVVRWVYAAPGGNELCD